MDHGSNGLDGFTRIIYAVAAVRGLKRPRIIEINIRQLRECPAIYREYHPR